MSVCVCVCVDSNACLSKRENVGVWADIYMHLNHCLRYFVETIFIDQKRWVFYIAVTVMLIYQTSRHT